MSVSLDPIPCACGRTCAYTVRGGPEHESAEARDPFVWVATAVDRESDGKRWAYVIAAHGRMSRREYWDTVRQLVAMGYEWVAYEHDGEITTVTKRDVEKMRGDN